MVYPSNHWNSLIANTVWRISSDAVVKSTYSPTEAFIMSHVSSHTSIPIPRVLRVLPEEPSNPECKEWWITMDYDGDVLESAWETMSTWRRLCAMWSVRRCIRELQKTPIPNPDVPGPFDASGKSYMCHGNYFTENGAGPFNSHSEMAAWFDRRRFDTWHSYINAAVRYTSVPNSTLHIRSCFVIWIFTCGTWLLIEAGDYGL